MHPGNQKVLYEIRQMMPIVRLCSIIGIDPYCTVHLVTQESRTATEYDM